MQVVVNNLVQANGELPKAFTFDAVFDWHSSQATLYEQTAKPIVDSVLEGYNGTVFAYGQTGTGKTHTMDGGAGDIERGIIPKAFDHIFNAIQVIKGLWWLLTGVSWQQSVALCTYKGLGACNFMLPLQGRSL